MDTKPYIYKHEIVTQIQNHYGTLLEEKENTTIGYHLDALALLLKKGLDQGKEFLYTEINNYHPKHLGKSISHLKDQDINEEICKETVNAQYGFSILTTKEELSKNYNLEFESAIDILLAGNLEKLDGLLSNNTSLTKMTSQYGHQATLLHYTASNGVELHRQYVPLNLKEIIICLLDHGADITATMNVYDGLFTTKQLMATSAHPKEAGVLDSVISLL